MEPIFTGEQLNRMSREDMLSLLKSMQEHRQKQEETLQKQETRIQLLEEKTKETVWCFQRKICGRLYPAESF